MEEEGKQFTTFERASEFFDLLSTLLSVDLQHEPTPNQNQTERDAFPKLLRIIDEYQEQVYLLDPYMERMVTPVVEFFKAHAVQYIAMRGSGDGPVYSSERLMRLTTIFYAFVKSRGRKTIVNFFPHQVTDLSIALTYLSVPDSPALVPSRWTLRYLVLLWLSLICMIPFDLSKFDDNVIGFNDHIQLSTSDKIDALATIYLSRAGLERDAAAVLLSKLYARKDTAYLLTRFLTRSITWLEDFPDVWKTIGILHVLCDMTKSGVTDHVALHVTSMRQILKIVATAPDLMNNTLIRKFKVKLEGRLAVGQLPRLEQMTTRRVQLLQPGSEVPSVREHNFHHVDMSETVEHGISTLLEALQDKDTTVRYSASKHLARVSSRLPPFLSEQVLESILQLFEMHSTPSGELEDLPVLAEATWHGACLACAEMARRTLVPSGLLSQFLEWMKKALLFDIRKGAHSIGSNVRDAASYALWALARSQEAMGLRPYALSLAQRLVAVSLYDREVHIRRAASAAFQENVGRLSVFPQGIDILRKTDFFAVGIRNNAFLVAAPQVANHIEYRLALVDHLICQTLVHWDPSMRILGAQSLRAICELDLDMLGPKVESRVVPLMQSIDPNAVHGSLLGLAELAASYHARGNLEEERLKIFKGLAQLPPSMIQKYRHEQILEATCLLIANAMSCAAILLDQSPTARWQSILEHALRHHDIQVQDAAACAMRALSKLTDCSNFAKGTPALQQSLARTLGSLAYDQHDHGIHQALTCLLNGVDPGSPTFTSNVEARCQCFVALSKILCTLTFKIPDVLSPPIMHRILRAYIVGLDDYTTDERGDVGSWIRVACIRGLGSTIDVLFDVVPSHSKKESLQEWMSPETYQEVLGGILKQGVERLDNVRHQAGESFLKLLKREPPSVEGGTRWKLAGDSLMSQLLLSDGEEVGWNEGQWLFPRAVHFLEIPAYRKPVLHGLVLSIGSKTDSTQRPVSRSFVEYTDVLPVSSGKSQDLDLLTVTLELLDLARNNILSNQVVIPVLQTFDLILEAGLLEKLADIETGIQALNAVIDFATRNVTRLKNIQRILTSMKLVNGMLFVSCVAGKAIAILPHFLLHPLPKVRTDTAENLYLVMQGKDIDFGTDNSEEIILETDWSTSVGELEPKVEQLLSFFKNESN